MDTQGALGSYLIFMIKVLPTSLEQYWGAAELCYRNSPKTSDINQMEKNVIACLNDIPNLLIQR